MSERKTILSPDRLYRYQLWRDWKDGVLELEERSGNNTSKYVLFIGLNPSTADETNDDPTIRRCIAFSKSWGYGALCMTNLFAFRATEPKAMMSVKDPVGPSNNEFIVRLSKEAGIVICAWGRGGNFMSRGILVCDLLREAGIKMFHLGLNTDCTPKHPLYLKSDTQPIRYTNSSDPDH